MIEKIEISNHKCFNEFSGFSCGNGINIIIGKNNSGKSTLLELIELVVGKVIDSIQPFEGSEIKLTCKTPKYIIKQSVTNTNIDGKFKVEDFLNTSSIYVSIKHNKERNLYCDIEIPQFLNDRILSEFGLWQHNYYKTQIRKINSERDIFKDNLEDEPKLLPNGYGASNYLQVIQNNAHLNGEIINGLFLEVFNEIVEPEISFRKIVSKKNSEKNWEVYFQNKRNDFIPISAMGSGVKTIFLVLANLILVPAYEEKEPKEYVYVFEELENNLHPSLQKRLYNYIRIFQIKNKCQFFLTTHSSTLINFFGEDDDFQLIHIQNDSIHSKTYTITEVSEKVNVIEDLGYSPSDILQTNGIIWVEGPSDRSYISSWLKILIPNYILDVHYSIMFYGGKLLSNLSFTNEYLNENLIPVLRINQNSIVVIDSDRIKPKSKINATKQRINTEIGDDCCWITQGKEIENYLKKSTINKWLKQRKKEIIRSDLDISDNVGNLIKATSSVDYNRNKSKLSREISKHITKKDITYLDLEEKLNGIVSKIKIWNKNNYP